MRIPTPGYTQIDNKAKHFLEKRDPTAEVGGLIGVSATRRPLIPGDSPMQDLDIGRYPHSRWVLIVLILEAPWAHSVWPTRQQVTITKSMYLATKLYEPSIHASTSL